MKRLGMLVAVGVLILGSTLPALAQQPPTFTVTFGGQMRTHGFVFDNVRDFTDTDGTAFKDSDAFLFSRYRMFTTVQSADKKAKAYWALEIGDVTWGRGGGAAGGEFGGTGTRVGPSTGGEIGNDGVNVETKNLYLQFDIPFVPGANLLVGAAGFNFLSHPGIGAFVDEDGFQIQFNWRADPVDLQVYMVKATENNLQDADDNTLYVARFGVNATKDLRFTVEGMVADTQCFARRAAVAPAVGTCVDADFGDTFWIGGTAAATIGTIKLDAMAVYGQRQLFSAANSAAGLPETIEESGFGAWVTARVPIGPVSTWWHGWYTTGDDNRTVGLEGTPSAFLVNRTGSATGLGPGQAFSTDSNTTLLNRDSDKLPTPIGGSGAGNAPYIASFLLGLNELGAATGGNYSALPLDNASGTYGVGGSASFALTPAFSLGGGVAYVGASEDNGVFGDQVIEIDAGFNYALNANLSITAVAGYLIPDEGDDAWAAAIRTQFAF